MIENFAHFIWFGESFPWLHVPALRSAVERGGFERAILHHSDDLTPSSALRELEATPGVELRRLRAHELLASEPGIGDELTRLFERLEAPAARANVVRAALLYRFGGVYLDADTVCVRQLSDLLEPGGVFCGAETVCVPGTLRGSFNPARHARSLAMQLVREALRIAPGGWRTFRRLEPACWLEVNNAVLAAKAQHPFLLDLLQRMVELSARSRQRRYALGTHLLQQAVREYGGDDLRVLPPRYFYPLGPEISQHWFRRGTARHLSAMLHPDTRVVHWYASVRTKGIVPRIDPSFVERTRDDLAISRLVSPWV